MNNGVTNNNTNSNASEQPVLMPMEGVKIAPVDEKPVDASSKENATSAPKSSVLNNTPVNQGVVSSGGVAPTLPSVVVTNQVPPVTPSTPTPVQPEVVTPPPATTPETEVFQPTGEIKKKTNFIPILLLIILLLIGYTIFSSITHKNQIASMGYNCTPITASKEETKLDLDSTIVKSLYNKVATTIREDLAQPEFNDNMRLYLAYRQILDKDKYDTNCNLFDKNAMEPYTCEVSTAFKPKAFKEETLTQAIKELYGENTSIPFANIRLGDHSCIGGYQYIPKRGEFVQGYCEKNTATSFKVTKTLKEAVSTRNTIILTEEVKYHENEKMTLPETLKSGYYYYTFRLDMNYNYVFVSKTYKEKY